MKKMLKKLKSLFKKQSPKPEMICHGCGATADSAWGWTSKFVDTENGRELVSFCNNCIPHLPHTYKYDKNSPKSFMRNERSWHTDIKARRRLRDGTIGRFDKSGKRYG